MRKLTTILVACLLANFGAANLQAQSNVVDEVVWIVGDEAILRSQVEEQYQSMQYEGQRIDGDPYCVIPEMMAVQKLFLHQAKIDSIEVSDAQVFQTVEGRINNFIASIGSREKVEEYFNKPLSQIREEMAEVVREQGTVEQMRMHLVKDVKSTPSEVRTYYSQLPSDSIPFIPTQVEVQVVSLNPTIPQQETDNIKARLREFSDRVNKGEADFSTLAVMYSEDPGSARMGGEIGFMGKGTLAPEYANVAFNLNDPAKCSQIVETEFGFHIIQLIEKRGDRINTRHILLKPKLAEKDKTDALVKLDSIRTEIGNKKFTFEEAAFYVSQDKDTRNNGGIMVNQQTGTTKFEMSQLPQDIAKVVSTMQVGDISAPFMMINEKQGKEVSVIVRLKSRNEGHKANISDDYQALKNIVEATKKEKIIQDWIVEKKSKTYISIKEGWRNCDFKYEGWIIQ